MADDSADGLDPLLALWARRLHERVGHYFVPTLEQWEHSFACDAQPQSELLVWEVIARACDAYCAVRPSCDRATVASDLLLMSMTAPAETAGVADELLRSLYNGVWKIVLDDVEVTRGEVFRSMAEAEAISPRATSE